MARNVRDLAWHRSIGKLLTQLDLPDFWTALVRLLKEYVPVDNWVVLIFTNNDVKFVCCRETIDELTKDALIQKYISGLYMLDPFYINNRENQESGLFHLLDIAPVHFVETEYYNTYFKHYVSVDEVQYNAKLDKNQTLCISLGSETHYTQEQIAVLDLIRPWVVELMRLRMSFERDYELETPRKREWEDTIMQYDGLMTSREMEVMRLLLGGFSNRQVAGKLSISAETVRVHRRNFYAKLNIKSQSEFFALFINSR